jgi:hypothetical protein
MRLPGERSGTEGRDELRALRSEGADHRRGDERRAAAEMRDHAEHAITPELGNRAGGRPVRRCAKSRRHPAIAIGGGGVRQGLRRRQRLTGTRLGDRQVELARRPRRQELGAEPQRQALPERPAIRPRRTSASNRPGVGGTIAARDTPDAPLRPATRTRRCRRPAPRRARDGNLHRREAPARSRAEHRRRVPVRASRTAGPELRRGGAVEVLGAPRGLPHAEPRRTAGGILPCATARRDALPNRVSR